MPRKRLFRVERFAPGGIELGSYGRRSGVKSVGAGAFDPSWIGRMAAARAGASEVFVKISGGGRTAGGVRAHLSYIDRHGKLDLVTDHGEVMKGKEVARQITREWALDYGSTRGEAHRRDPGGEGARRKPRQTFNIVLSMPAGTPPPLVLMAAQWFARERFANQHRYAMALHAEEDRHGHGRHPHVHLVVKAEHEYGGPRLSPRKADLREWREEFARAMTEFGVPATATQRADRGLVKTHKRTPIERARRREGATDMHNPVARAIVGASRLMQRKVVEALAFAGGDDHMLASQREPVERVRALVNERYNTAVEWMRRRGHEWEAEAFAAMRDALPPVKTESQALVERMVGEQSMLISTARNSGKEKSENPLQHRS